jgi:T5SS/PEP-CTERM-associated repeat protein
MLQTRLIGRGAVVLLATLLIWLVGAGRASAQTVIYVNAAAQAGGNGQSWATAYRDIDSALAQAETTPTAERSVEIWVAAGTYKPSGVRLRQPGVPRSASFIVRSGISIVGGFAGGETSREQIRPRLNRTVLSGDMLSNDGASFTNRQDNVFSVVFIDARDRPAGVTGVIIRGGQADGPQISNGDADFMYPEQQAGAGVLITAGTTWITACEITDNSTIGSGGGVFAYHRTLPTNLTISDSLIVLNRGFVGAAIASGIEPSTTLVRNCVLAENRSDGGTGQAVGGAIVYADRGDITFHNSILANNRLTNGTLHTMQSQMFYTGNFRGSYRFRSCIVQLTIAGMPGLLENVGTIVANPSFSTGPEPFSLAAGSVGIDAGQNSLAASFTDIAGNRRFASVAAGVAVNVDIGAFERDAAPYSPVLHVNADLATGAGDGSSWASAFRGGQALAAALNDAVSQPAGSIREIWLARGTYTPSPPLSNSGSRSASFVLINNISILGGFHGNELTLGQRPPLPTNATDALDPTRATILSGDLNGDDLGDANRAENSYHVLRAGNVNRTAILDGVTVASGNADGSGADGAGAGIRIDGGSPLIRNCFFLEHRRHAIYNSGGTPRVENCTITRNAMPTSIFGGAVTDAAGGAGEYVRCFITSNTGGIGAGAYIEPGTPCSPAYIQTVFADNRAEYGAGFATVSQPGAHTPKLINCQFVGNIANSCPAIGVEFANVTMTGCILAGNEATGGGSSAMLLGTFGQATITNCTFAGNRNRTTGGGDPNPWGALTLGNNTAGVSATIRNSIFWGNTTVAQGSAESSQIVLRAGSTATLTQCIVQNWSGSIPATFTSGTDPLLQRIPSPGDSGDVRPSIGSPAIDAGDLTFLPQDTYDIDADGNTTEVLPVDVAGFPRLVDDPSAANTGPGNAPHVDLGAYEAQVNCLTCPGVREWRSAIGGVWDFPSNWTPSVPNSTHDTLFNLSSTYTVSMPPSIPAANLSANSALFRQGNVTLNLSGGTLNLLDIDDPSLIVGDAAGTTAQLSLTSSTLAAVDARVGSQPGSLGVLNVGAGSLLNTSRSLTVGFQGSGVLSVSGGGRVFTRDATVGDQATSAGYAQVAGAGSRWDVPFFLIINNGEVNVRDGATLTAGFGVYLFNDGVITGNGTINASVVNFGRVQPGNSPGTLTINGSYQQIGAIPGLGDTAGGLVTEIAGRTAGTFDTIQINGQATLGGGLYVAVDPAFTPNPADTFDLVSATTGITRPFDVIFFQGLSGSNAARRLKAAYSGLRGPGTGRVRVGLDPLPINPGFAAPLAFTLPSAISPDSGVATGDVTGDGVLDAVIALPSPTGSGPGSVAILPGVRPAGGTWQGFGSPITLPVGVRPAGVTIGDLDGDGRADLLVANSGSNTVSLLRQNPAPAPPGGFAPAVSFPVGSLPASVEPVSVVLGDFDRDALIDLAVANRGGLLENGTVAILRNTGSAGAPAFAAAGRREIPTPPGRKPVIINPFNPDNDKDVDLAVSAASASGDAGEILVFINGSGASGGLPRLLDLTGPSLRLPMPAGASALAASRLLPGSSLVRPDLVAISPADNSVCVLLNTTTPGVGSDANVSFAPFVSYPLGGEASPVPGAGAARGLALVDMDGDSDSDLAVLVADDAGAARAVLVLRNDSTLAAGVNPAQIAFALLPQVFDAAPAGAAPVTLASDDVDGDARRDLLTAAASASASGSLAVLRNTLPPPSLSLGACCRGASCVPIPIGDCTGLRDVFTSLGQTCNPAGDPRSPCCKADFNKLSGVTIDDIFIYLNFWFAADPACDVDGAGTVTIDDIFIYLNAWFAGC